MKLVNRLCVLAALGLVLAACSLTRLAYMNAAVAYANATPMLTWFVGDYVQMSVPQKEWVRERLSKALAWHRTQELPEYRRFLETLLAHSEGAYSVEDIRCAHSDLRTYYHRALEYVLPDLADFLLQLDSEQAAQMERKFTEDNRRLLKELRVGTQEERLQSRANKYIEHFEEWVGELTPAQRRFAETRLRLLPDLSDERLADRRYRQAEILALVRSKPPREQMVTGLHRMLIDTPSWRRPQFTRKLQERNQQLFELIGALSTTLEPSQRAHLQKRLRDYLRDITYLTALS